jgi:hypothetical protein
VATAYSQVTGCGNCVEQCAIAALGDGLRIRGVDPQDRKQGLWAAARLGTAAFHSMLHIIITVTFTVETKDHHLHLR